jgi:glycine dehydrogenase
MSSTSFAARHIGPRAHEVKHMLNTVGVSSLEQLIDETVPAGIRNQSPLAIGEGLAEHAFLNLMREKASKNKVNKNKKILITSLMKFQINMNLIKKKR